MTSGVLEGTKLLQCFREKALELQPNKLGSSKSLLKKTKM